MTLAFIGNRNQRVLFFLIDILFSQIGYFKFFTLLYVLSSACKCQNSPTLPTCHQKKKKKRKKERKEDCCNFLRVCVKSIEQFGENQLFCILNLLMSEYYSVQFSRSVMSDSSQPHGLQHTRLPCPSPTPGAYPNSRPSSW